MISKTPRLWQYNFSNYNEKARWALDVKGIPHRRRTLMPGEPRAFLFSARGTLPILDIEGQRYGDSTEIIAALERIQPDPPLYPQDPELRERALALEDHLDEETGHAMRRALFWEVRDDRSYMVDFITQGQPAPLRALMKATFPVGWVYVRHRYAFAQDTADAAWGEIEAALDLIETERDGGPYLVGETFTVADLTASALLWPLAWPPEFPYELPAFPHSQRLEQLRAHPAVAWIGGIYARHRPPSAEIPA